MAIIPKPKHSVVETIYALHEQRNKLKHPHPFGSSIGPSQLGNECDRALWYTFRWASAPDEMSGRKLRLFETGHREEARVIAELRAIGVEVAGEQQEISALAGHLHGYLDGIVLGIEEAPKTPHVLEIKTHNEKSYADLWKKGVHKSKPSHYAQMQLYMHHVECDRGLYLAVNKNDDTLYSERVRYDKAYTDNLMKRVERIVRAQYAPTKLHEDPSAREAYVCGWCPARDICHEGEWAKRNCRTCLHVTPVMVGDGVTDDGGDRGGRRGVWRCEYWDKDLTLEDQRIGCTQHRYLPALVPGEQLDAVENKRQFDITYRLVGSGQEWTDGLRSA